MRGVKESHARFSAAVENSVRLSTTFSAHELSQQLQMVARTIAARSLLGFKRRTFFLALDGFDHHDEVPQSQAPMLGALSRALGELGVRAAVTAFTISDLGRTLTSNGRDSDHGWGGNQLVMGGAVGGGDFYGNWPALYAGNSLDTGRGRLVPTLSTDAYYAELSLWFGARAGTLSDVLPNLTRSYSIGADAPVGFMV